MVSQATPRYISKRKSQYTHKKLVKMFTIVLTVITLRWKQPQCLTTKEWMMTMDTTQKKKNTIQINILKNYFEQTKSDTKAYSLNGMFIWISRAGEMNWWWQKLEWRLLLADLVTITGVGRREPPRGWTWHKSWPG